MNLRLLAISMTGGAVLLAATACGKSATTAPTVTLRPVTPTAAASAPASPQPSSTPGRTPAQETPVATPMPAPTTAAGFKLERAPIDGADLLVEESNPVQYAVYIASGLPSGCHVFDHVALVRNGAEITIDVWNRLPDDPMLACTAIYGTHETTVQLGSDFANGSTYRVHVNERTLEFTAK